MVVLGRRSLVDRTEVDDGEVRIVGRKEVLEKAVMGEPDRVFIVL